MSTRSANEMPKFNVAWALAAVLCAAGLAGCTGSSDGEAPMAVNSAPMFDGDSNVSVDENTTSVGTASANDVDGDGLTYAISGGDDPGLFEIDPASGNIVFATAPDFEQPEDLGRDNVYTFIVTATDGNGGSDTASFTVTVSNLPDERYIEQLFAETVVSDDILYATVDGQDLVLNLVTPVGDTETERPFILLATGGAFAFTERAFSIPIAEVFARTGYVAATTP